MRLLSFDSIQKKLDKKNVELTRYCLNRDIYFHVAKLRIKFLSRL